MRRIQNSTSGSGHICGCDDCVERLDPKAIRNGVLLGGALWLVLGLALWGVLKVFG